MTELKVDAIVNLAGSGKPNLPVAPTVGSNAAISTLNTHSYTSSGTEPSSPKNGALWWDSANDKVKVYIDGGFKEVELNASSTAAATHYGDRAHKAGVSHTNTDRIEYWDMTSAGNAADFGNLTTGGYARQGMASDGTRIYMPLYKDTTQIDFWASATLGNASDYGDLQNGTFDSDCESDGSKMLLVHGSAKTGSGNVTSGTGDKIEQFTIGTGNAGVTATDFGNQLTSGNQYMRCVSNATRMLIGGGLNSSGVQDTIAYVTFATAGNAVDAGDLNLGRYAHAAAGSGAGDIGCFAGGNYNNSGGYTNSIDQKNITNTNNATDFGDLATTPYYFDGCSNATKGHFLGGYDNAANAGTNSIQQITFDTASNATDFGDLLEVGWHVAASSGAAS